MSKPREIHRYLASAIGLAVFLTLSSAPGHAQQCTTERISVNSQGQQGSGYSSGGHMSYDGLIVSFSSASSNLVPGDTNQVEDVFVRDLLLKKTERISVSSSGVESNGHSSGAGLSDDGRYVLFYSRASNLDSGDTDSVGDVYLRDRQAGVTELISKRLAGQPSQWECIPSGMSGDGRFVAFYSRDSNLVPGDANGLFYDVFLVDRQTGGMELVSLDSSGNQAALGAWDGKVSDDGRFVVMASDSADWQPNLTTPAVIQVFQRDRALGTLTLVSAKPDGLPTSLHCAWPSMSGDGRYVAFEGDGDDLVVGEPPNSKIRDVYVRDMRKGVTELITWNKPGGAAYGGGRSARISKNGRYVAFESGSGDLVVQDGNGGIYDVFVRDRYLQVTTIVSRTWEGLAIPKGAQAPMISGDGRLAGFSTIDDQVVPGISGWIWDVYVRTCTDGLTSIWCGWKANTLGCKPVVALDGEPSVGGTGGFRVDCTGLVSNTLGLFYYGVDGTQGASIQAGFQCVLPPILRTPVAPTGGGGPPANCTGALSFDLDAWLAAGKDPRLIPGTTVYGQFWSRDPGAWPFSHLSSAVAFVLQP